jgi:hypothetical protein
VKSGNQALLDARMSFARKQSNGERCTWCKAMPYDSSRVRGWDETHIFAIALATVAAVLDDLKPSVPRALYPSAGAAMTTKEAFDIVLALAFDNMVDEEEMPEIYKQQSEALELVAEIARYYGSRRK